MHYLKEPGLPHRRLVIYVDGSIVDGEQRKSQALGWGLVALHDDQEHERRGHILGGKHFILRGCHEQVAFVHGVLYARDAGFDFKDVSIYCDDQVFGYAPFKINPNNYAGQQAKTVLERLALVNEHAFEEDVTELVLEAFHHCHIVKLKGHTQLVYQERVDYLARFSARQGIGLESSSQVPLDMQAWLKQGIELYKRAEDGTNQPVTWRAAFVEDPQEPEDQPKPNAILPNP